MPESYICNTCGVAYAPSEVPPGSCPICEDDRQYVSPNGQKWTTMAEINRSHQNVLEKEANDLFAIYSVPSFAIGQRAHLLLTAEGNILWDCITNLDSATIEIVKKFGGLRAICISHPHYFSAIRAWSRAFGDVPVYVHALDASWLGERSSALHLWDGSTLTLWDGIRLIRLGGHFPGANILYWPAQRSLLTGDTIQVCPGLDAVSCMYSYPNLIPLPKTDILRIRDGIEPLEYDRIYGAFGRNITGDARRIVDRSLRRYLTIYT